MWIIRNAQHICADISTVLKDPPLPLLIAELVHNQNISERIVRLRLAAEQLPQATIEEIVQKFNEGRGQ